MLDAGGLREPKVCNTNGQVAVDQDVLRLDVSVHDSAHVRVAQGSGDLEDDGHIDMFFCRHDMVCQGVGGRLYQAIEDAARGLGLGRLFTEASITARPFFERQGFTAVTHNAFERNGVEITNLSMEKILAEP